MIKRTVLITTIVCLLLIGSAIPALAAGGGDGVINGRLVNATENFESSVGGIEITLKTYLNGAEKDSTIVKTDDGGNYVFEGLATDSKYSYDISTVFQEADYQSEEVIFTSGETQKSVDLTVYDSTAKDVLQVTVVHTLVTPGDGKLLVQEYVTVNNDTDKAYVGSKIIPVDPSKKETIRFALPQGAANVSYDGGLMACCAYSGGSGFVYGMAVLPGALDVLYSYEIPYKAQEYTFTEKFEYPTAQYNFLVQSDVSAASDQMMAGQPVNIQGKQYNLLAGADLTSGDTVSIKLAGLTPAGNQNAFLFVGLAVLVLGGGAGGFYAVRRRKERPVAQPVSSGSVSRQSLLVEIARLDDEFESGRISESRYRALRAQKKAQVVALNKTKSKYQ